MSLMPSILMPDVQLRAQQMLRDGTQQMGLALSDYQHEQLMAYLAMIVQWNRVYNLTAIRNPLEMVKNHLLDSLSVVPLLRAATTVDSVHVLDVGAGAGLPGMVIAIVQPSWHITMIDAVQKKTAFIQQAIGQLRLSHATVRHGRVETLDVSDLPGKGYDLIVSRAFSSQRQFIELAGHLLKQGGKIGAMKGKLETDPGIDIPRGWAITEIHPVIVPGLPAQRHLILLEHHQQG